MLGRRCQCGSYREKHGFERVTSDEQEVFSASDVDCLFSITQHHLHAAHAIKAVESGKALFLEKPLCISLEEFQAIEQVLESRGGGDPRIMIGFNRRFAPLAAQLKQFVSGISEPLTVSFRFNAGAIPAEHWTQIDELGGGRIIGEACHAVDFVTWLTGSLPVRVFAESVARPGSGQLSDDQCFITVRHENGSVSNIAYLAGGDKACPKERIEVHGGGRTAILEDFTSLVTFAKGRRSVVKDRQNKGHRDEVRQFLEAVSHGRPMPIAWSEIRSTTLTTLLAVQSLREGCPFDLA